MYAYSDEKGIIKVVKFKQADKKLLVKNKFKYDRRNDWFFCSMNNIYIQRLVDMGVEISSHVFCHKTIQEERQEALAKVEIPRSISRKLFKYQVEGLKYMQAGYSLVAFEMGLRKNTYWITFYSNE